LNYEAEHIFVGRVINTRLRSY